MAQFSLLTLFNSLRINTPTLTLHFFCVCAANIWVKIIASKKKPAFVLHVCMSYSLTIFLYFFFFSLVEDLTQFLLLAAVAVAMVVAFCNFIFAIVAKSTNSFLQWFLFLYCICCSLSLDVQFLGGV